MQKFLLFFLSLIFILTACDGDRNDSETAKSKLTFELEEVKQQYAGVEQKVVDISEQSFQNGAALAVTFSVPLDPADNVQDFFKVSDASEQKLDGGWIISANGRVVFFPEIQPNTRYSVDVLKGLPAATGVLLAENVTQQIKTRDMPAQVGFASNGSILPAKLATGLPVISVNVNEVDVDFHRIKSDKVSQFVMAWNNRSKQSSYYLREYAAYADLIYTGRFDLNPPENTRYTSHLHLADVGVLKQPGVYMAVMKQAGSYDYDHHVTYFVVSDLGLHARLYRDQITVQVSSLENGLAIPKVTLILLDKQGKIVAETKTSTLGQGVFHAPDHSARVLLARNENNISLLKLNGPALDLTEFAITGRQQQSLEFFMYGPRDLYRPGETVTISALLRDKDGNSMTAPPLNTVLMRPDGQKIKYFIWHADSLGYYQTEFTLPKNARTGKWTLQARTADNTTFQYRFQVAAFLPERMELQLGEPQQEYWTDGQTALQIPISGHYLYGAPAAGNRLDSRVIVKQNRHPVDDLQDYFFGQHGKKPPIEFFQLDALKLDAKGQANLQVPAKWQQVKHNPYTIKIISSLFETGGRPVTRAIEYNLWPQETMLGIRPQQKLDAITADSQIGFDLVKAQSDGILTTGEAVVSLIKQRRDYYWEYSDAEGWHSEFTEKNYKVFEQQVQLNASQAATINIPVEWGSYLLVVKDSQTGQTSSLQFYAGGGWRQQSNNQAARPDRVVLKLDKKYYQNGDTARLQITPPYAGNGFIVVENSNQPLWLQRVNIPAAGQVLELPIADDWQRHDIYISAVIFRPGDKQDNITPNRAVGVLHLPLERAARKLQVEIEVPKSPVRPETTVSTRVKISGAKPGKKNLVTLAAVDTGVLNITDYKTPDPFLWFFSARRYAVEQRDLYGNMIDLVDGGLAKPRFGGDADQHAGGARPDSAVKIVALFSGPVAADEQGIAKIDLDIPDFNGKLRLMAVVFNDQQYGSSEAELTVVAPVIAEASLPRFLAAGDQTSLTLDVRNQSGRQQYLSLNMQTSFPLKMAVANKKLLLEDKQKQVLRFPLSAESAFAEGNIQVTLNNQDDLDEAINISRTWQLGVRPAYPALNKEQRKVLKPGATVQLNTQLDDLVLASASGQLNISPKPPLNVHNLLQSLLRYPYGCLEQTISSTYPWLNLNKENLKILGLDKITLKGKPVKPEQKVQATEQGITRLAGLQRSNGSFGLWSNTDSEAHWLSAYAADFLLDAREQGINVPQPMLDKTMTRLTQYLNSRGSLYGEAYSEAPGHLSFAYKAYAGYVLSRVNRVSLGSLRTLYAHHKKQLKGGLPLVHLGLALINQGDQKQGKQIISEGINRPREENIYLGDYGSPVRDYARMLYLLKKQGAAESNEDILIYKLADELNNRDYLSTQEQQALFRAGLILNKNQTPWQGDLTLGKTKQKISQRTDFQTSFQAQEIPTKIAFKSTSEQALYLQWAIQGYPQQAPIMNMESIQVERNYYNLEGQTVIPEQLKSGDVLLVHLVVTAKQRIRDALVVDLLAAGFELENQGLTHSLKIDEFRIADKTIAAMQATQRVKYQEYLDDRYVAAVDLHKNKPQHLFYLVRAVTPGTYTNPSPLVEDMYRPYLRAIGRKFKPITITLAKP